MSNGRFDVFQESMNLSMKIDQFIKDHKKWRAEYKNVKRDTKINIPVYRRNRRKSNEGLRRVLTDAKKRCDNSILDFANNKRRIQEAQKQKIDMDMSLIVYKKQLENINASKQVVSPLDDLEEQLKIETDKLSKALNVDDKLSARRPNVGDEKINKILSDLDKDMNELNELLK